MATFYLRGHRTEKQIWVRVKNQGKEIRLPIGVSISESLWSTDTQRPKRNSKEGDLSAKITILDNNLRTFFHDLKIHGGTYGADDIQKQIDEVFPPIVMEEPKPKTTNNGIVDFIGEYIESMRASGKRDISVRCMGTFKGIVERFIKECEPGLTWDTINGNTGERFDKWMKEQGYTISSINKQKNRFRTVARKAGAKGYHNNGCINEAFKNERQPKQMRVYLNPSEILALANMELDAKRSVYRDLFLIECLSAQRIGDVANINPSDIHTSEEGSKVWEFEQSKTGTKVRIVLIGLLDEVFAKYNYQPPKVWPQLVNRNIKNILHELSETIPSLQEQYEVLVPKHEKAKAGKKRVAKWECVSNHSARRSAITNMINSKAYSIAEIMNRSGHETAQAFELYDNTTVKQRSDSVAEIQRKREIEAKSKGEKLLY